jgi:DNA-binding NarL/FixJ family response regulator
MLTPRQTEIAQLVAKGYTAREMSAALGISIHTAQEHVAAAAERIPGDLSPRKRLQLFVLQITPDDP